MKRKPADPAGHYFNCTDSERAVFEAGIKLGTIYHQYIGAPVNRASVHILEKAIEAGALVQPFVKNIRVSIDKKNLGSKKGIYTYKTLNANMLSVRLTIRYKDIETTCELQQVPEIRYPLMYIHNIKRVTRSAKRGR
jgi:hypothetical protein